MTIHDQAMKASQMLERALMNLAMPHHDKSATVEEIDRARQFSFAVTEAAFGTILHDYGAGKFNDEQLAAMLPKLEGAFKVVQAMTEARVSLPVQGTLFERMASVIRAK